MNSGSRRIVLSRENALDRRLRQSEFGRRGCRRSLVEHREEQAQRPIVEVQMIEIILARYNDNTCIYLAKLPQPGCAPSADD